MAKTKHTIYQVPVFIERDKKWFSAFCPSLQGCYAQGKSLEDVLKNIREAIELHIEDRIKEKEFIPTHKVVSMSTLEVAI